MITERDTILRDSCFGEKYNDKVRPIKYVKVTVNTYRDFLYSL